MVIEVLEYAARLIKNKPKVVLPNTLTWIPLAMLYLLLAAAVMNFSSYSDIRLLLSDIPSLIRVVMPYILAFVVIIIIFAVITVFVKAVYPSIVQQSFAKKTTLSTAFSAAKARFLPLLWTDFLLITLFIAAAVPLVLLAALGIAGVMLSIIGLVALFVILAATVWVLDAVVVLEKMSGIAALRRSFDITKRFFLQAMALLLLLIIITMVINAAFGSVPVIGFALSLIASLFTSAFTMISQSAFYFVYEKKAKIG